MKYNISLKKYKGTGKMRAVLQEGNKQYKDLYMGNYKVKVMYEKLNEPSFGIIIQKNENEFIIIIGMNLSIYFESEIKDTIGYIVQVLEGRYENEKWITTRMMNGVKC
ncbi:hypothetical protein BST83_01415 [Polaribacter filamentus]|uniref:DUF5597 domain-containing protein n=1 Tax=Polaribacter filamentus TaxID=53483 RepID=A0A2S7L280_9FLAO|nr:DUF5597 domain-containing protein [Polaribacter filamentus]PQB09032.1 hypothetical protein BST83_01415 [Polaribacter filamentus]